MSKLLSAIPVMPVKDVAEALAFWKTMGFETWGWEDPPIYGGAGKDEVEFHLYPTDDPAAPRSASCRLNVETIAPYYEAAKATGRVHPEGEPADQPWGYREFTLLDSDGACYVFCEAIPD
jgi:catechol 2,3-dioxygenase-like lactoylglutathione lyase family enzyme